MVSAWLQGLLEEHFDELQMCWEMRQVAIRDPEQRLANLEELDDRIEAHIDALILAKEDAWPILEAGLAGEPITAFAGAYVLLRSRNPTAMEKVLQAFELAEAPARRGICEALCHSSLDGVAERLKQFYDNGKPDLAAAAAEVFASHGRFHARSHRLPEFLASDDPEVRRTAWRVVSLVDDQGAA